MPFVFFCVSKLSGSSSAIGEKTERKLSPKNSKLWQASKAFQSWLFLRLSQRKICR